VAANKWLENSIATTMKNSGDGFVLIGLVIMVAGRLRQSVVWFYRNQLHQTEQAGRGGCHASLIFIE